MCCENFLYSFLFLRKCFRVHAGVDGFRVAALREVVAFNDKEVLVMRDDLAVYAGEAGMAERKVIDGVKQVGLSLPVVPDEAVDIG